MEPCKERKIIDSCICKEIEQTLRQYGVPDEKVSECYDRVRFRVEARGVLLNRVPERSNETIGYYGKYLEEIAQAHEVKYVP